MALPLTPQLSNEYRQLFDTCIIDSKKRNDVEACVAIIVKNKSRYETVAAKVGVPWYFIGILHNMEGNCNFNTHLHNGDPLTARTVQVPAGPPKTGNPPFTWESAEDALRIENFATWFDWSTSGMLYKMELYNGVGYRRHGINSPYLWSASNHYTKGKFTSDGFFDPNAVSKQIGAAVLLRRMAEKQIAVMGEADLIKQIKTLGETVAFDPNTFHADAEKLQQLLNSAGQALLVDGKAGRNTSDAYHRISGRFLKGDVKAPSEKTVRKIKPQKKEKLASR